MDSEHNQDELDVERAESPGQPPDPGVEAVADDATGAAEDTPAGVEATAGGDSAAAAALDDGGAPGGDGGEALLAGDEAVPEAPAEEPAAVVTAGRVSDELKGIIEALIYASPDPLTPKTLFKVLESEPKEDVQVSLEALRRDFADRPGGLHLVEVAGGYQIVTRPELSEWVRRLFHERKTAKLSVQALETLAVIAYKQPITAPEITEIRGVNTSGVVATLLERRLVKIAGRKAVVGRPFLYATTREFLIRFGLRDLNDLPKIEDIADVLGFEPPAGLTDNVPATSMLPLDEGTDPDKTLAPKPEGEVVAATAEGVEPAAEATEAAPPTAEPENQ